MLNSRVATNASPILPVKPTISFASKGDLSGLRSTQTALSGKLPVQEVKSEASTTLKPPFTHPKSAPVRPADDPEAKKQHFVFLGNLMTAQESRESVLARQKQYYDELSKQVMEKKRGKDGSESLTASSLTAELQTINEELRGQNKAQTVVPENGAGQGYTRFRKKHEIENHLDLQVSGNSFFGGVLQRDEIALIRKKKEDQQKEMQEALRRQIDEKKQLRQAERQAQLQQEVMEEQTVLDARRKLKEEFDRENGVAPKPHPIQIPDTVSEQTNEPLSSLVSLSRQPSVNESSPKESGERTHDFDVLTAKMEQMEKSNLELMERVREQSKLISQMSQKPSRSNTIPRPKPPSRVSISKDSRKLEEQKRKEKHDAETAKIKAYEMKIENARRKKEAQQHAPRGRQTSGLLRQSTYDTSERPTPLAVPRMQSAFAPGLSPLKIQEDAVALSASKIVSSRAFFGSLDASPVRQPDPIVDLRQNLDTAGESHFIYPKADGTFYPSGHDELDKLIESENQKLGRSPSIPELGMSHSRWVPVPQMEVAGHQSQMSYMTNTDAEMSASKVSRFPRDVFGTLSRKRS